MSKNLERKTWEEFRKSGLFMFVNLVLQAFGWSLVVEVENYKELGENAPVKDVYPCRSRFRGFSDADQTEMHERIAAYLGEAGPNFKEEIKD